MLTLALCVSVPLSRLSGGVSFRGGCSDGWLVSILSRSECRGDCCCNTNRRTGEKYRQAKLSVNLILNVLGSVGVCGGGGTTVYFDMIYKDPRKVGFFMLKYIHLG